MTVDGPFTKGIYQRMRWPHQFLPILVGSIPPNLCPPRVSTPDIALISALHSQASCTTNTTFPSSLPLHSFFSLQTQLWPVSLCPSRPYLLLRQSVGIHIIFPLRRLSSAWKMQCNYEHPSLVLSVIETITERCSRIFPSHPVQKTPPWLDITRSTLYIRLPFPVLEPVSPSVYKVCSDARQLAGP